MCRGTAFTRALEFLHLTVSRRRTETVGDMPRPKMLSSSESIAPKGLRGCGRQRCRPRHCSSQRKRDRVITFLLPSCFLTLSGFRFKPLGGGPSLIEGAKNLSSLAGAHPRLCAFSNQTERFKSLRALYQGTASGVPHRRE